MLARPVDGRADLYALSVVLFQCATGHLPYRHDDLGPAPFQRPHPCKI